MSLRKSKSEELPPPAPRPFVLVDKPKRCANRLCEEIRAAYLKRMEGRIEQREAGED